MSVNNPQSTLPSTSRPSTWNSNRRGLVPKYAYKTIKEIHSSNDPSEFYNVYGVVIDIRPAEKSRGSDYFCILRIVDPSFCHDEGVKVTLFHPTQKFLPNMEQWDIIRLHRVKAKDFKGSLLLTSSKGWSWASWKGNVDNDVRQNATSCSISYTIVDDDVEKVKSLRRWIANRGYASLEMVQNSEENSRDKHLSDINPGCFFNLICQVVGVLKVQDNTVILKVWDGTMPSHKVAPGTYPENEKINIADKLESVMNYMVDVSVFDNHAKKVLESGIVPGNFLRFQNLHASPKITSYWNSQPVSGGEVLELFLHGGRIFSRGVTILDNDYEGIPALNDHLLSLARQSDVDSTSAQPSRANMSESPKSVKDKSRTPEKKNGQSTTTEGGSSESFQAGMPGSSRQVEEKSASSEIKKTQPPPVTEQRSSAISQTPQVEALTQVSPAKKKSASPAKRKAQPSTEQGSSNAFKSSQVDPAKPSRLIKEKPQSPMKKKAKLSTTEQLTESEAEFSAPSQELMEKFKRILSSPVDAPSESLTIENRKQDFKSRDPLAILLDIDKLNHVSKQSKDFGVQVGSPIISLASGRHAEAENSSASVAAESSQNRKFITSVSGTRSQLQASKISEVLNAPASVGKSRDFRVRAQVLLTKSLDGIVRHYCPVTGLSFSALNHGQSIELSDKDYQLANRVRQRIFSDKSPLRGEGDDEFQPTTDTQWPAVGGSGDDLGDHLDFNMQTYECVRDGSRWETLKCFKSNITRKRKKDGSRFNILYCQDSKCTANLKTVGKNFQRVIRVSPASALTSRAIPAVAYQDGVYYYCSPACVVQAAIPSLEEEANNFDPEKPLFALGCPLMPLRFDFMVSLTDESASMKAVVKGLSAVELFGGMTPQQFLLDKHECRTSLFKETNNLIKLQKPVFADVIIRKISRRPLHGKKAVTTYEIINTKLSL